jgi:hypothetical protein
MIFDPAVDILKLTNLTIQELTQSENRLELLRVCNARRQQLPEVHRPDQSDFRVYCLLIVDLHVLPKCADNESENKDSAAYTTILVEGRNCEAGYIGGSICAERSALVQLSLILHANAKIVKVVGALKIAGMFSA